MPKPIRLPFDPITRAAQLWTQRWGRTSQPLAMASATSIMRVQQLLITEFDTLVGRHGLTFARYEVLRLLAFSRRGVMPVGKIGERLQVHPASVTNAVQRLEGDGLVRRFDNPDDGRSVLAEITAGGRRLVETCTERLNAEVFATVPIAPAQRDRAFAALKAARAAFGDFS